MDRLLTDEELRKIRAQIPGTFNVIEFAREVSKRTSKAQDTKTEKIVRDQWRQKCEDLVATRHKITKEESVKAILEDLEMTYEMCIKIGDYREFADNVKAIIEALKREIDEKQSETLPKPPSS